MNAVQGVLDQYEDEILDAKNEVESFGESASTWGVCITALAAEVSRLESALASLRSAQVTNYCSGCEESAKRAEAAESRLATLAEAAREVLADGWDEDFAELAAALDSFGDTGELTRLRAVAEAARDLRQCVADESQQPLEKYVLIRADRAIVAALDAALAESGDTGELTRLRAVVDALREARKYIADDSLYNEASILTIIDAALAALEVTP